MNPIVENSWSRAWRGLQARGDGLALRDGLLGRYAEPWRHYHTLQHLEECLRLFDSVCDSPDPAPDHPAEVEMALWFHDAIYALRSSDNEEQSAALAVQSLTEAGVPPASVALVRDLVLVTRHTAMPTTLDEQTLVDIDLAILGASEARFAEYERQIREEYAFVPGFLFRMKRKAIMRSFLERNTLYHTPQLHQRLEAQARFNLAKAIG